MNNFQIIKEMVEEKIGEQCILQSVWRDGKQLTGICVPGWGVSPVIYLDFFADDDPLDVVKNVCDLLMKNRVSNRANDEINSYLNRLYDCWEEAKTQLVLKVKNHAVDSEYLSDKPTRFIAGNLSAVLAIPVSAGKGRSSFIVVSDKWLESWGVTKEDAFLAAEENGFDAYISKGDSNMVALDEFVLELSLFDTFDSYLVSNKLCTGGASLLAYPKVLQKLSDIFLGQELLVFPMSVHDVMVTPLKDFDLQDEGFLEYLKFMMLVGNNALTSPGEILDIQPYVLRDGQLDAILQKKDYEGGICNE